MKKTLLILFAILSVSIAKAQEVTLLTFESYTFADKLQWEWGDGKVYDGFQWGAGLEFGLSEENAIELIYQNLATDIELTDYTIGGQRRRGEATFNYIFIGGTRYMPVNETVSGFGTIDVGMVIASPKESQYDNVTKFTWAGRLGVRVKANDRLSMRVHAQITNPVQAFGGGLYFGTGGAGAGVSTYSTIWQFNLGGSVNIRLK